MNSTTIADTLALRALVDNVSIYGDQKDLQRQLELFTEDAIAKTYANNKLILDLKGRAEMEKAFPEFLKNVHTLFHCNGQQVVNIDGDTATGTCYCQITMLSTTEGKTVQHAIKAVYNDTYQRAEKQWLIAARIGNFVHQQTTILD